MHMIMLARPATGTGTVSFHYHHESLGSVGVELRSSKSQALGVDETQACAQYSQEVLEGKKMREKLAFFAVVPYREMVDNLRWDQDVNRTAAPRPF